MSVFKELYVEDIRRRKESGQQIPDESWTLAWTDVHSSELQKLRDYWKAGRKLRAIIVELRAQGKPIDEAADLIRDVKRLCDGQLKAWQPTAMQRGRPH